MFDQRSPSFDKLTKKERRALGLDEGPASTTDPLQKQIQRLSKGTDKRKVERELKKLERGEWE